MSSSFCILYHGKYVREKCLCVIKQPRNKYAYSICTTNIISSHL